MYWSLIDRHVILDCSYGTIAFPLLAFQRQSLQALLTARKEEWETSDLAEHG